MGNEENQKRVSLVSQRPWKSLRDSHIPTAPTTIVSPFQTNPRKEPQRLSAPAASSGSSFDEKMLFSDSSVNAQ